MRTILLLFAAIIFVTESNAQGCVAIRSTGGTCNLNHADPSAAKNWQVAVNYRYFKSFRHFVGTEEQKERMEHNTEVINWQHTIDVGLVRQFNNRWSASLNLPLIANKRSSLYEHGGNSAGQAARHNTHASGIGDMRLTVYRWLFNPAKSAKGNIQAGIGIKLPTGDYQATDFFVKNDSTQLLGPVDQSIQPGDGGTGATFEANGYYVFARNISGYVNAYYLLNPREQNGVSTARGGTPNATAVRYVTHVMSVPDQYMLRGGVNVSFGEFTASGGVRYEAIPSEDLVGGSRGFRRPGYVISAEPGLSYMSKKTTLFLSVPVALERNRTQSWSDKRRTTESGTTVHGDAAFADYSVNIGMIFKL